jgi:hypothetical protein
MDAAEMLRLFESHREAKAAPDIDAILETFVSDCFLETVPLGFEVRARTRSGRHIEAQFFTGVPRSGSRRRADGGRRRRHRRLGHVAQNDFHTTHPPLGGRPGLTSPDRPGLRHREQPHSLGGRRAPLTRALSAPPTVRNHLFKPNQAEGARVSRPIRAPSTGRNPCVQARSGRGRATPFWAWVTDVMRCPLARLGALGADPGLVLNRADNAPNRRG